MNFLKIENALKIATNDNDKYNQTVAIFESRLINPNLTQKIWR